jgi:hypothetical protein
MSAMSARRLPMTGYERGTKMGIVMSGTAEPWRVR